MRNHEWLIHPLTIIPKPRNWVTSDKCVRSLPASHQWFSEVSTFQWFSHKVLILWPQKQATKSAFTTLCIRSWCFFQYNQPIVATNHAISIAHMHFADSFPSILLPHYSCDQFWIIHGGTSAFIYITSMGLQFGAYLSFSKYSVLFQMSPWPSQLDYTVLYSQDWKEASDEALLFS